jgi:glycosyltransferase involved in cell wall biosynthesis
MTRAPVDLVYPGADLNRFNPSRLADPARMRTSLGLPEAVTIGIVGRLQRWKGMHVFLDAMRRVVDEFPEVRGVIVGGDHPLEPEYPKELRAQCKRLGLGDAVRFAGPQADAENWMQAMDIVVHASDREPFGIVIVEAMALGKPVVAGDAGGPAEIIDVGRDGLLSPYGDVDALASHLIRLVADPELRQSLGAAARQAAERFSAKAYAANLHEALAGVIERGEAG